MPDFHCNAKYFLITYSQSTGLDEWAVVNHFSSLGAECIVAREDHADGGTHLHAFVAFGRKFRSRRPDIFDVDGRHPNIVPSRGNPGGGWDYAIKDGEVVAGGLERPGGGGVSKTTTPWHWIISASSGGELRDLVRELAPKEAILRHREIEHYIANEFAEERPAYVHPIGFEFELGVVPDLVEWRRITLDNDQVEGNHFFARGKFNGREFVKVEQQVDYYVFDDMEGGLRFFPGWKHFLGMQTWFNVRQFHRDPPMVKGGKPCIWICNLDPREEAYAQLRDRDSRVQVENDVAWLEKNCIFVEVAEPIFRANTN
nr:replication-associated protein [Tick-associated gemycircularvirus 5]